MARAHAVPGVKVLQDYSHDFSHPSCVRTIANRQIDQGSTRRLRRRRRVQRRRAVGCRTRGVWGVGADEDMSYPSGRRYSCPP